MFDSLKDKLQDVFSGLAGAARSARPMLMRRCARFVSHCLTLTWLCLWSNPSSQKSVTGAVGSDALKSVRPDQQVIKLVNDALTEVLGGDAAPLNIATNPPSVILMVGLQGSGKTTTAGKLASRLRARFAKGDAGVA